MTVKLDHLSGRFNRLAILLFWVIMRSVNAGVDVITLTEVDKAKRGAVLHRVKGFQVLRAGNGWQGESAILVRTSVYKVVTWDTFKAVDDVPGGRGPQVVVWAVIEDRITGRRGLVLSTHHGSGVETAYRKNKNTAKRRNHTKGLKTWGQKSRELAKEHACEVVLAPSDLNLNMKNAALRREVEQLSGFDFPAIPKTGTFKRRVIDALGVAGDVDVVTAWVLPEHKASDHRGFRSRTTLPALDPVEPPVPTEEDLMTGFYLEDHPPARRQFRQRYAKPTGLQVIHTAESVMDTVGPDTGAEAVAGFIARRADPGSYHSMHDSDSTVRLVQYAYAAYGDGTGSNEFGIHHSAACRTTDWARMSTARREGFIRQMAKGAADANAWLIRTHGVSTPARRVTKAQSDQGMAGFISHGQRDPARRTDPGADFPWALFLKFYAEEIGETTQEDDMPAYRDWDAEDKKALMSDFVDALLEHEVRVIGSDDKKKVVSILTETHFRAKGARTNAKAALGALEAEEK